MVPKAQTAEFFGFYDMSSKFAGILGPLLFAVVGQLTGTSRLSIISLVVFFVVGGLVLSRVDEREGIRACARRRRPGYRSAGRGLNLPFDLCAHPCYNRAVRMKHRCVPTFILVFVPALSSAFTLTVTHGQFLD